MCAYSSSTPILLERIGRKEVFHQFNFSSSWKSKTQNVSKRNHTAYLHVHVINFPSKFSNKLPRDQVCSSLHGEAECWQSKTSSHPFGSTKFNPLAGHFHLSKRFVYLPKQPSSVQSKCCRFHFKQHNFVLFFWPHPSFALVLFHFTPGIGLTNYLVQKVRSGWNVYPDLGENKYTLFSKPPLLSDQDDLLGMKDMHAGDTNAFMSSTLKISFVVFLTFHIFHDK